MQRSQLHKEHFKCIKLSADTPLVKLQQLEVRGSKNFSIREDQINLNHCTIVIRRVFIKSSESGALADIGWVLNEGVRCCLSCHKNFTSFIWRHHCRACGLLICSECSRSAKLDGLQKLGTKRVCKSCLRNHATDPVALLVSQANWGKIVYSSDHGPEMESVASTEPDSITSGFSIKVGRAAPHREDRSESESTELSVVMGEGQQNAFACSVHGKLQHKLNHYHSAFAPCRSMIFDQYDEPAVSFQSSSLDTALNRGGLLTRLSSFQLSANARTQNGSLLVQKASSTDDYTRPQRSVRQSSRSNDTLRYALLKTSNSTEMRSGRTDSEEAESIDFALTTGSHRSARLHQAFRFDRDASAAGGVVGYATSSVQGQALLTSDCMEFRQELCVHSVEARALKEAACQNTRVLLGWQVLILRQDHTLLGLGVVTAVHKSLQRQSFYRISTDTGTDCWLRLKRRARQSGTEFQPLLKVLHSIGETDCGESVATSVGVQECASESYD